jgi:hypothetical protein
MGKRRKKPALNAVFTDFTVKNSRFPHPMRDSACTAGFGAPRKRK